MEKNPKPLSGSVPPSALDAEKAVLGAIVNFKEAFDSVSFMEPDIFYDNRHQTLFEAVVALKAENRPVDLITITQQLSTMGKFEEVPPYFVVEVANFVASSAHIVEHALIVNPPWGFDGFDINAFY